jgi:hypothetical protein
VVFEVHRILHASILLFSRENPAMRVKIVAPLINIISVFFVEAEEPLQIARKPGALIIPFPHFAENNILFQV